MVLETLRLTLATVNLSEADNIHVLHSLPETDEFNTLGIPENRQVTEKLINNWISDEKAYVFSVNLQNGNKFIGLIALIMGKPNFRNAEIWYKTSPTFWRNGYTLEALKKILAFGFEELHLHRIEAGCATENIASIKLLEKAGMTLEGTKRKILPIRGKWKDSYSYALLDSDFIELLRS